MDGLVVEVSPPLWQLSRRAAPEPPLPRLDAHLSIHGRSRYPDKALVGAERKAREREARCKQLRYGVSLVANARIYGFLVLSWT
jgi:hypothetical protein